MQGHIRQVGDTKQPLMSTAPKWLPLVERKIPREPGTGRPMIVPPGGTEPVPYERMSQVADAVDTLRWLMEWYRRMTARGVAASPDLQALIKSMPPEGTPEHRDAFRAGLWDDILERAHDRAGGNEKADLGTAVHLAEHYGTPIEAVPTDQEFDTRALRLGMEYLSIQKRRTEVFVVNDELMAAGTFDHEAHYPMEIGELSWVDPARWDQPVGDAIGDIKTGKYSPWSWSIQNSGYANGSTVDIATVAAGEFAERTPLDVSTEIGVIAWVPRYGGCVRFDPVDIAGAYEYAKLARLIKVGQDRKDWVGPPLGQLKRHDVLRMTIDAAPSRAELHRIATLNERWLTEDVRKHLNRRFLEVS